MRTDLLWSRVEGLVASASGRVVVVAPFIKRGIAERIVAATSPAARFECYTRWEPDEVAQGVSDPDIVRIPRFAGNLHLCPSLHAKLIVADDRALVGSANLTAKALGLAEPANIEIMVEVSAATREVIDLLAAVRALATPANANLADAVVAAADAGGSPSPTTPFKVRPFYPSSRRPQSLEAVYRGSPVEATVRTDLHADLVRLGLPAGLSTSEFRSAVANALLGNPVLESFTVAGAIDSAQMEVALVESLSVEPIDARRLAETMLKWVEHFCEAHVEPSGWRLVRGKEFG